MMGESKSSRATKNSQKVASLEDQNKVLEEVLKASRKAAWNRSKEKPPKEGPKDGSNPGNSQQLNGLGEASKTDRKRKGQQDEG